MQLDVSAERQAWDAFLARAGAVSDECELSVSDDGIATVTNQQTHAIVDVGLGPDAFESYHVGEETVIGLNLDTFRDVVGLAEPDETVRVALDDPHGKLHVAGREFEYSLAQVDREYIDDPPDFPSGDGLAVAVDTTPDRFKDALSGANVCLGTFGRGVSVDLEWYPADDEVGIHASGDTDSISFEWARDDLEHVEAPGEVVSAMFGPGLLQAVLKPLNGDETARFEWGDEYPLYVTQDYAGAAGGCRMLVAPRRVDR